jgi:hypothetical protein
MQTIVTLTLIVSSVLASQAQTPAADRPAFEVASVKLHPPAPGPFRSSSSIEPGGIRFTNVNLKGCIQRAYGVPTNRISGGPDWTASERYDIVAKAASAAPQARLMLMLQTLLEDRFQLKFHRETIERPIYALVSPQVDLPVFDVTGLVGVFDVTLDFQMDDKSTDNADGGQSIFTALQEQLGLKLEPRKGPVETLVIDHAAKASDN